MSSVSSEQQKETIRVQKRPVGSWQLINVEYIRDILSQADFNFLKIHLLSHYNTQIKDFGSLPQYLTEVTEALHKLLKDAYRRSNHVNATEQILDIITREHALRMRELNIKVWSREFQFGREIIDLIRSPEAPEHTEYSKQPKETPMYARNSKSVRLGGKQVSDDVEGTSMRKLAGKLILTRLLEQFYEYLRLNTGLAAGSVSLEKIAQFPTHYYTKLSMEVPQFQSKGAAQNGKIVGRLEGLLSVRDHVNRVYEVALVLLLQVRGSKKPGGDEGMVRMERGNTERKLHIVRIGDIEGMAHLIGLKEDSVWLMNNRIDMNTWNELYD
ncbi:hypothetical protein BGX38DRAFT_1278843 [Terfezia claveryi]|nr:hypothetical protein BGX38DRAFT_1278843 [Terfezia claveryi]